MTEFYVKVQPGSEEFDIENGPIVRIKLKSRAENGRANSELIKKLEEILEEKPGIVSGHKSRRKKLKVQMPKDKVNKELELWKDG